jgi:hypothetical protein
MSGGILIKFVDFGAILSRFDRVLAFSRFGQGCSWCETGVAVLRLSFASQAS